MSSNCKKACAGKYVVSIQDTTEINLSSHSRRINKDDFIGTTNAKNSQGLGFFLHRSLVLDAQNGTPYGYASIKVWNRPLKFSSKFERGYNRLPIEEKESYKWLEVSKNTQNSLKDAVPAMVIVQDREGDIYEQFATIPDATTELLVRARTDRKLKDKSNLFSSVATGPAQGSYQIEIDACAKTKRKNELPPLKLGTKKLN